MREEPLLYRVTGLPDPIEVDGNWDKPAWKRIEPLVINRHMGETPAHRPGTLAKLAWDGDFLCIIFRVEDRYVRAAAREYQDPVCGDSCVEFFFTPGSNLGLSYFNVEVNCGGTMLFWWHPEGGKSVPVAAEDGGRVEIGHTLSKNIDPEIAEPTVVDPGISIALCSRPEVLFCCQQTGSGCHLEGKFLQMRRCDLSSTLAHVVLRELPETVFSQAAGLRHLEVRMRVGKEEADCLSPRAGDV